MKTLEILSIPFNRIKFEIIKKKVKKATGITIQINKWGFFDDYHFAEEIRNKYGVEGTMTPKNFIIDTWGKKFYDKIQSIHLKRLKIYKKQKS